MTGTEQVVAALGRLARAAAAPTVPATREPRTRIHPAKVPRILTFLPFAGSSRLSQYSEGRVHISLPSPLSVVVGSLRWPVASEGSRLFRCGRKRLILKRRNLPARISEAMRALDHQPEGGISGRRSKVHQRSSPCDIFFTWPMALIEECCYKGHRGCGERNQHRKYVLASRTIP